MGDSKPAEAAASSASPVNTTLTDKAPPAPETAEDTAKREEKEERRRLKEAELKLKGITLGGIKPKMSKAERRALQEKQRAEKQEKQHPTKQPKQQQQQQQQQETSKQHTAAAAAAAAARSKGPKINMENRVVPDDKRMHLYLHLDLPQHPPSSASALFYGHPHESADSATEHGTRDIGLFDAGIKNAAFPPGPQVVTGMAEEDYVAMLANEPAVVKRTGPDGTPVVAMLRNSIPPFSCGPGHRKIVKPSGNLVGTTIHPRIKEVGLRMATMEIAGSNARTLATLRAFIDLIADYTTPSDAALNRNLIWNLSAQINFLVHQRPMCIGMGNAIRWLKNEIAKTSAGIQDDDAKTQLIAAINDYVNERITAAGDVIADAGAQKIQDGDVVLTYGASSTVQRLLIAARDMGRRFRVIVVDSRPENDGRKLVRSLVRAGFSDLTPSSVPETSPAGRAGQGAERAPTSSADNGVTYAPITALSFVMREASKAFLGAEALFANGAMLSRAGTAIVALAAHSYHVPVIVSCETYKFSERIQLDAVVNNELGVPDTLMYKAGIPDAEPVGPQSDRALAEMEYSAYARDRYSAHPRWNNRNGGSVGSVGDAAASAQSKKGKGSRPITSTEDTHEAKALRNLSFQCPLSDWRSDSNLRLVNITQDVTPPEFVSAIITEVGMIPTTSIPVVLREYKNQI